MKSSNFQNDINNDGDLDKNEILNFNNDDDDNDPGDAGAGNLISKLKLHEEKFNDFDMNGWVDLNAIKEKINSQPPAVKLRLPESKPNDNDEPILNNNNDRRNDDDDDAAAVVLNNDSFQNVDILINDIKTVFPDNQNNIVNRWTGFLNWLSDPGLGLEIMRQNSMTIKMGDISKENAGQLYVDGRLILGENLINFISDMNNDNMMVVPGVWSFNSDLNEFLDYLNSKNSGEENTFDALNYSYLKFLSSQYNEFIKQSFGSGSDLEIIFRHTNIRDPMKELRQLQKTEWTKFLQILFDYFINRYANNTSNNENTRRIYLNKLDNKTSNQVLYEFDQGLRKITNSYTIFYNRFRDFLIDFIFALPVENLRRLIKNINFYSGNNIDNTSLNLLLNENIQNLEQQLQSKIINEIIDLSIKCFFQTGKLPISEERILNVGDIDIPPNTTAIPDIVSLYYQYADNPLIQNILSIQSICMWLYAFNIDHRELVRAAIQELFMNLSYESLRYPLDNMRFLFIEAVLNNFGYEFQNFIQTISIELENAQGDSQTITFNKNLTNFEKQNIAIEDYSFNQYSNRLEQNMIEDLDKEIIDTKLKNEEKINEFIEDGTLEWDTDDINLLEKKVEDLEYNPISDIKIKQKNQYLTNLKEELIDSLVKDSNAEIIEEVRRREAIHLGNINNLTRQIEILNDQNNLLNNKIQHNYSETLPIRNSSIPENIDVKQIEKYLRDNNSTNVKLLDTVNILKEELTTQKEQQKLQQEQHVQEKYQLSLKMDAMTENLIKQNSDFINNEKKRLQDEFEIAKENLENEIINVDKKNYLDVDVLKDISDDSG